jgi:hypothetical protein
MAAGRGGGEARSWAFLRHAACHRALQVNTPKEPKLTCRESWPVLIQLLLAILAVLLAVGLLLLPVLMCCCGIEKASIGACLNSAAATLLNLHVLHEHIRSKAFPCRPSFSTEAL